MVAQLL